MTQRLSHDELWSEIEIALEQVFRKEPLEQTIYSKTYSNVYDFCTSAETGDSQAELYSRCKTFLKYHIELIKKECEARKGEDLLTFFTDQYDLFKCCAKVMDGLFAYLNRHWIKRQIQENQGEEKGIFTVDKLALNTWKELLLEGLHEKIVAAVVELSGQNQEDYVSTHPLLKKVDDCFVELELKEIAAEISSESEEKIKDQSEEF
ncbi:hypothetical protein PMAYCL1PPCAC_13404 [Pristionchus mayeri]|uniref:Cullin N-terminal domain-containing protein n=1 Tax=Pristionchus mayeri TaxID=1317129 RepID=A0AAN4ZNN1_9BILA|nr:hypothetical protein PMAYCL1PPCAC_13404 [Pristionchus mayeri]